MLKGFNVLVAMFLCTACGAVDPKPAAPHEAMSVSASAGRAWDAAVDEFARQNIPIKTIDRQSGVMSTDRLGVNQTDLPNVDCGGDGAGTKFVPTSAMYTVIVRGDSSHSTVRASGRWESAAASAFTSNVVCSSRGAWETAMETKIKTAAEMKK